MATSDSPYFMGFLDTSSLKEVLLFKILKCYINPIFSLLGLATNGLSVVMICHSGLNRPSNILLFSLVVADSMSMLQTINIPQVLTYFDPQKSYPRLNGWQYSYGTSYFLYCLRCSIEFVSCWGCYVNSSIPVIITSERLCAIFWPLKFNKIFTNRSAVIGVAFCFVFWFPINVYDQAMFKFQFFNVSESVSMGVFATSEYLRQNIEVYKLMMSYVFEAISIWVPLSLVSVGCLVIGIKIKMTMSHRRALTASRAYTRWSPKTTRTLLATCLVFSVTRIAYSIIVYALELDFVHMNEHFIYYEVINFIYMINNSANFFVYVMFSNKFRVIFIDIFRKKM
ncbi:G-protein coupled receptor [Biomphalaria glabrata]|nr:G-protein coupled receptor [Biomphalaria glabrata]